MSRRICKYTELLEETSSEREVTGKIRDAANYLLSLTSSLIDYAQIDMGGAQVHSERVEVRKLIGEIESVVWPLMRENHNILQVEIAEEVQNIETDPTKLKEIILNLLQNAAKYTHEGRVELKCTQDREHIQFVIADTGRGIPRQHLPKIFEAFTRAHQAGDQGVGLGLSITRRLCELLGGKIEVESVEGHGTQVRITFPRPD